LSISSCESKEDDNSFSDGITFGTSVNYSDFTLNGEGTSFSVAPGNVAIRLESEEDYDGNPVKFIILKNGSAYSTDVFSNNPVPTGHIFITTLNFGTTGQYSVTASIEKTGGSKTIATGSFQMN